MYKLQHGTMIGYETRGGFNTSTSDLSRTFSSGKTLSQKRNERQPLEVCGEGERSNKHCVQELLEMFTCLQRKC